LTSYLSPGGVIAGYEGDPSWKTEVVGMLVEDRVGLIEDSTGDRTVERLVDSSLTSLKDEQTSLAFMALGVCPEDVLVALPVAQLICVADADVSATGKLSSMSMRRILKTLLDRHLIQGSIANGVQMHDIVRDLVRSRLGGAGGIREKQRAVVAVFVAACPAGGGWPAGDAVGQYAAFALEQHMAEALQPNPLGDADAQAWLLHPEDIVAANAATAIGSSELQAFSAAKEAAGDLVFAARIAWAARLGKHISQLCFTDLVFRATDLLEIADDSSIRDFEMGVLKGAYVVRSLLLSAHSLWRGVLSFPTLHVSG
jgi:urease accessory protein UreF